MKNFEMAIVETAPGSAMNRIGGRVFQLMLFTLAGMAMFGFCVEARANGTDRAASPASVSETIAGNPQTEAFVADMAARGLDAAWVRQTLEQANKLESVRNAIKPTAPGQRRNWQAYHDRFVEPARTEAGIRFMREHAETLTRASHQFGVPVEVIVGILGVETYYGRYTGRYRVLDSLATLAFDYPVVGGKDRSPYFREQLAEFFVWCAKERCDPLTVTGSYAGAMGLPQFMPGNIHRYGSDFDGNGHINLHSPEDAIGSVARFLARHGWVRELAPVFAVDLADAEMKPLLAPDILPTFTAAQLEELGAQPLEDLPDGEAFAVVELENGDGESKYVLGSRNFYVLTRYNRSSYYAMAVLSLGENVIAEEQRMAAADSPPGRVRVANTNAAGE